MLISLLGPLRLALLQQRPMVKVTTAVLLWTTPSYMAAVTAAVATAHSNQHQGMHTSTAQA
jgi:hypothetical protein